jgi:hypothetical protein
MTRTQTIAGRLASATILLLALAACGGGSTGAAGSADAGADDPAPVGTTTAVAVTGAQTVTFDAMGGCGKALGDDASWGGMFTTVDGTWLLDITLEDTFDPGTYMTADHESGQATVFMTDGAGTTYDAMLDAGQVTVDAGARSGSILATLTADDGNQVTVEGPWQCESWD